MNFYREVLELRTNWLDLHLLLKEAIRRWLMSLSIAFASIATIVFAFFSHICVNLRTQL